MESNSSRPSSPESERADSPVSSQSTILMEPAAPSSENKETVSPDQPLSENQEGNSPLSSQLTIPTESISHGPALSETGETAVSKASSSESRETATPRFEWPEVMDTNLPSSFQSTIAQEPTSPKPASPEIRIPHSAEPVSMGKEDSPAHWSIDKKPGGYIFRLQPPGRAVAAATDALDANRKVEEAKLLPDKDLMAMEVHGRSRFMWDTSSFQRNAPREKILNRCLYDQISGRVKKDGYFADAAYVGYSMYAEGPVFVKRKRVEYVRFHEINGVARLLESRVDFQGSSSYIEPGYKYVPMEVVPHYDATTMANITALYAWIGGSSAEKAFGEKMPLGYVLQQAEQNARDLAEGRSPMPVTRLYAFNFQDLPKDTPIEKQLMVPDEERGFDNPCLADVVCHANFLTRGCGQAASGYSYGVPCTGLLEYPDLLLKTLRDFAHKYTKDRLTEKGLLLATHLWVNITNDPALQLELLAQQRKGKGEYYQPVPPISLAQCLIYYPHWLRWVANMGLVEFIHPFRFIHKAVETDLANNPNAGMEVEADDIDESKVRALMNQVRSIMPEVATPKQRNYYCPFMLPGSTIPPLYKLADQYFYTDFHTALTGLEHVRFLGLPTYARPVDSGGTRPTTFVLVQPRWATTKVICQRSVMPYLDYMDKNPDYPGYKFVKRWAKPVWRDMPVKVRTDWQWW